MPPINHDLEIKKLLEENQKLLKENNELLHKLYRNEMIALVFRFVWYGILIGLPFLLYFYVLEPYFAFFGANFETFKVGIGELPGFKGIEKLFPGFWND